MPSPLFRNVCTRASHVERGRGPGDSRHHREPKKIEDDYDVSSQALGTGLNGDVTMATSRAQPGQKFAVKTLQLSAATPRRFELMKLEVANHLCLDHPHIVRLFDVYESSDCIHLVMECMDGGEVFDRILERGALTEDETCRAVQQILLALAYIHNQGIVHRDVKLENCVYQSKDSDDLKLLDFGLSARWDSRSGTEMHDPVGTLEYIAPELLHKKYTNKCDLWSLGVTTIAMITGCMPFSGTPSTMELQIATGSYSVAPEKWSTFSIDFQHFLPSLMNVNPHKRFSAQQALAHPWMSRVPTRTPKSFVVVARSLREFSRTPKFHHRCMQILAMSLPSEEQSKVREYFLALDKKNQGVIDVEDIRKLMVDVLQSADEKEISEVLASLHCRDGDVMQYTEFVAAMMGSHIAVTDGLVKYIFRRFDVHGSNTITAEDCSMVCGDQMQNASIQHFIEAADKNGNKHISLKDFDAYLRTPPMKESIFDKQDSSASQTIATTKEQPKIEKRFETSTGLLCLAFPLRLFAVILLSLWLLPFSFSYWHCFSSPPRLLVDSPPLGRFETPAVFKQEVGHTTITTTTAPCVTEGSQPHVGAIGIDSHGHSEDGHVANRHSSRRKQCVGNARFVPLTANSFAPVSTTFKS